MNRLESTRNPLGAGVKQYGSLIALGIAGIFLGFHLHSMLVYVGLWLVQRPRVIIYGWNTSTILAWSRFVYFSLGCTWLFGIGLLDAMLRRWIDRGQWKRRMLQISGGMVLLFVFDNLLVLILSRIR